MTDPTPEPERCAHEDFAASVTVNRLTDTGCFTADIRIKCSGCGKPFRSIGLQPGSDYERPTCSIDGLELRAPIEPEDEPRLFSGGYFRMPPPPVTEES